MIYKYGVANEWFIQCHSQILIQFPTNNMTHIFYSPIHMFKPSLKRNTPASKIGIEPRQIQTSVSILTRTNPSMLQQYSQAPSFIVPSALFSNTLPQGTSPLFTPLNFEWVEYPQTALQMIDNEPLSEFIARDIGTYKGVFWFFNGQDILLWRQGSRIEKRFELPQKTDFVTLGELQSSSLHFKSRNTIIMAAGCQNFVHLFGLNQETLDCQDFKFCYQIANSGYIQKIKFVNKEELVLVSDTGQHYLLDFKSQLKVCRPDRHFLKRPLPYFPFLFPQKQNFYEQVLVSGDYICSLVREERKANWFSVKAKQITNSLLNSNRSVQWILEDRVLQFYRINRQNNSISLRFKIKERQILEEIKAANSNREAEQAPTIVAINLKKSCPHVVEIAFSSGIFLEVDISKDFRPTKQPTSIISQNLIGTIGFFTQKKNLSTYQQDQAYTVTVMSSFGFNNLAVLKDSLCYQSSTHIEVVKNAGFKGKLLQLNKELLNNQKWIFLTAKGFFKIQRLAPSEVIIGYMSERDRLESINFGKKWTEPNNFQLFIDTLVNSIGPEKVIESLITVFLKDKKSIHLHPELVLLIERDLQGEPRSNIRDWSYELQSQKVNSVNILITEKMRHQMMQLIVQLSGKLSKRQPQQLSASQKIVGAYWQAVKSIFHQLTNKIIELQPKDMKVNRINIKQAQQMLQNLGQFFTLKAQKQRRLRNQFYVLGKEHRQPQQDFYSYFKRKQYLQPQKKLQDSIDTQAETIADHKFVTESSKALESDIVLATQKLKSMIVAFAILADISQSVMVGTLKEALGSIESQMRIKTKLIQKCADTDKLWQINAELPELELNKDLRLLPWMQKAKNYKWIEMFNLEEISSWLNQANIRKVLGIFQKRVDLQMEVLLHYWRRNAQDISLASQLFQLQGKVNHLYCFDRKRYLSERISYCSRQQQLASEQLQVIVSKATRAYIQSEEEDYPQAERILNNIIQLAVSKGQDQLCNYLEVELARIKVAEKIKLFKTKRAKFTYNAKANNPTIPTLLLKSTPVPSNTLLLTQRSFY